LRQQDLDTASKTFEIAKAQYEAPGRYQGKKRVFGHLRALRRRDREEIYEVGELLLPGKQIATIVNPDKIYVLATIDEVDVGRLRLISRLHNS